MQKNLFFENQELTACNWHTLLAWQMRFPLILNSTTTLSSIASVADENLKQLFKFSHTVLFYQEPLFLDILGTCHSETSKPAVLQYKHIERYRLHMDRGLSFTPPEVYHQRSCTGLGAKPQNEESFYSLWYHVHVVYYGDFVWPPSEQ